MSTSRCTCHLAIAVSPSQAPPTAPICHCGWSAADRVATKFPRLAEAYFRKAASPLS